MLDASAWYLDFLIRLLYGNLPSLKCARDRIPGFHYLGTYAVMDNQFIKTTFLVFLCSFCWFASASVVADQQGAAQQENEAARYIGDGTLPSWVVNHDIPTDYAIPHNTITEGTYYVMVDEQTRITANREVTEFNRYVTHVVNQKGIEENAQIQINFDPVYETVLLHRLSIIRDGETLDKLQATEFSLLHNEDDLAAQLYNGKRKLHGIVADIRTGDVLDYSYSLLGNNPVFDGAYGAARTLQWSVPVEKLSLRYSAPTTIPLKFSFINTDATVTESVEGDVRHYHYQQQRLAPEYSDDDLPRWYAAYPKLYVTTRTSWQEVVNWGTQLFAEQLDQDSAALTELVNDIRSQHVDVKDQITQAIQFVQNEVRYYGIELGLNSHRPSFADDTLTRRYGDCKDKSTLLINLLRKLGVEANPVLVNSRAFAELPNLTASEVWFNHAIVQIKVQDQTYWIDPTREMQFGSLDAMYQKDFGHVLVLETGQAGLTRMQAPPKTEMLITDVWDLKAGKEAPASFLTVNQYSGLDADEQRNRIANDGVRSIQTSFLEHYQNYYKTIKNNGEMDTQDLRDTNRVILSQGYQVPELWDEDDSDFEVTFYSEALNYLLNKPEDIDRSHPLSISYPEKITQNIHVYLYDLNWSFDEEDNEVTNQWFTFRQTATYVADEKLLKLSYAMETHQDHVAAADLETYLAALKEARGLKNYGIIEYKKTNTASDTNDAGSLSSEEEVWNDVWESLKYYIIAMVVWPVMLGLYLYLRKRDHKLDPYEGESQFFPISNTKLLILGLLTSGVYFIYWFYRNYQFERQHYGRKVMPFWRALFYVFFYYPMYRTLTLRLSGETADNASGETPSVSVPGIAILFAVVLIGINIAASVYPHWMIASIIVTLLLLLPMTMMVNKANRNNNALAYNSRWHPRYVLLIAMFAPLTLYSLAFDLSLTPDTKVVKGDALYSHDVNYMINNDVIAPEEEIAWFYSGDTLFIRNDGNGVTNEGVFSYWRDDANTLVVEKALFEEIADIQINWSDDTFEDTSIEVKKRDGEEFVLYLSIEDGMDKAFVNFLNRRWKPHRD